MRLLILLCMSLNVYSAELISDLNLGLKIERCLDLLKSSREPVTRRTAFGVIALSKHGAIDESLLRVAIAQSKQPGEFDKTASLLALSADRDKWCEALYKARPGQELAAATQAAIAIMNLLGQEKSQRIPSGKKNQDKPGRKVRNKTYSGKLNIPLLHKMLGSKSSSIRELALIAAAYQPDPALDEAVLNMEVKSGVGPGAKLLYLARSGKDLDPALLEKALGKLGKQPKPIRSPNSDLMQQVIRIPALALVCEALGVSGESSKLGALHDALFHGDIRVEIEAARAIGRIADPSSVDVLLEKLFDRKSRAWPVRMQVLDAIGLIPDAKSIPPLIQMLSKEQGRLRLNITYALNSIRGERAHHQTAKQWSEWWSNKGHEFKVDKNKTRLFRSEYLPIDMFVPTNGEFYGLPIFSDRLCFVVDTSFSMKGIKIANLREQLNMAIEGLHKAVYFNLVDFGGKIKLYYEGDLCQDKKGMMQYVTDMPMSGGTRSFDSMELGMEIDVVDTIYFLSDGAPIASQINKWQHIHAAIDFITRYRPIAIFSVSFSAGKANAMQMEKMSRWNSGRSNEIE